MDAPPTAYTFGPYRFEPGERRLLREGEEVELLPKELDLLTVLVAHAGQLVTKDDLMASLWPDAVVEENALTVQVSRLRAALGETARGWRFIETVPRAGYRFAHPVTVDVGEAAPQASSVVAHEREARVTVEGSVGAPWAFGLAAGVAIALVLLLVVPSFRSAAPSMPPALEAAAPSPAGPAASALPPTSAPEAVERGRAMWWLRRRPQEALYLFRSAVLLDSLYAPGYVGIADVLGMGYATGDEARAHVRRALALDPDLGAAYASLGLVRMFQDWDWDGAAEAFARALALDPAHAPAHQWQATLLMIRGQAEAAVAALDRALGHAPPEARPVLLADRCQALYYARRYDDALADCRRALDLDPAQHAAQQHGFWALALDGRADEAARWAHTIEHATPIRDALEARPAHYAGPGGVARLFADLAAYEYDHDTLWAAFWHARLSALTGDTEGAFAALDRLAAVRQFHAPFVGPDPAFDSLRDDPRFGAFLGRVGLAG